MLGTEGKVGRNGWCQHQGAVKGRVLEEGTDLLGLSRYLWLGVDVPPPPPPASPAENWELLLSGLQTSCCACKQKVFCVQCPAPPAVSFLPPSSSSVLFSSVQGREHFGQDCFQQGVCYTCLMRKTNTSHQLESLFTHMIKIKSTSIQYLQESSLTHAGICEWRGFGVAVFRSGLFPSCCRVLSFSACSGELVR